jgi:hypothetical protein
MTDKVKYPSDERLMQVCYDALSDTRNEELQNRIKRGGWKRFFNKSVRSSVSK